MNKSIDGRKFFLFSRTSTSFISPKCFQIIQQQFSVHYVQTFCTGCSTTNIFIYPVYQLFERQQTLRRQRFSFIGNIYYNLFNSSLRTNACTSHRKIRKQPFLLERRISLKVANDQYLGISVIYFSQIILIAFCTFLMN